MLQGLHLDLPLHVLLVGGHQLADDVDQLLVRHVTDRQPFLHWLCGGAVFSGRAEICGESSICAGEFFDTECIKVLSMWKGALATRGWLPTVDPRHHVSRPLARRLGGNRSVWGQENLFHLRVANFQVFLHLGGEAGVLGVIGTGHPDLGDWLVA